MDTVDAYELLVLNPDLDHSHLALILTLGLGHQVDLSLSIPWSLVLGPPSFWFFILDLPPWATAKGSDTFLSRDFFMVCKDLS